MTQFAQTSVYGFIKIAFDSPNWQTEEYQNWDNLDGILSNLQSNTPFVNAAGAVNAYTADYTIVAPTITALTTGLVVSFSPAIVNTGPSTLNINGYGAKNIFKDGVALVGGEMPAKSFCKVLYDGTQFKLIEPRAVAVTIDDASITPAKLSAGHPSWNGSGDLTAAGTGTFDGDLTSPKLKEGVPGTTHRAITHSSTTYDSGRVTFSVSDPSGGNDGDIWIKYS